MDFSANGSLDQTIPAIWLTGVFLAGFLTAILITGISGRAPVRFFTPLLRILAIVFRPLRFILRQLRILPKTSTRVRTMRNAAMSASAAIEQRLAHSTQVEISLSVPDEMDTDEDPSDVPVQIYDFAEEEKRLKRDGGLFRSIQIHSDYFPRTLTQPMSEEIADEYVKEARRFFNSQVLLNADEKSLYEDAEGAFIISMFRRNDRRCYYLLNEMRKTINGNARRLIILFTIILTLLTGGVIAAWLTEPLYGAGACLAAIIVMLVWHNAGYMKQQQHNSREMRSFLTRYLGRISDRYREATGIARGVTVGDETDSKHLSEAASKWHKIMLWMPFRTFFIECFVRSVLYQINRNCSYYMYIPRTVLVVLAGFLIVLFTSGQVGTGPAMTWQGAVLIGAYALTWFFYFERINTNVIGAELSQLDWLGYDNLSVSDAMDDVVGKYAEDVGFWKRRLDR